MINLSRILCSALLMLTSVVPAVSHEFWISPRGYTFALGAELRAEFRNGENFNGNQLAYFDRSSKRLQIAGPAGLQNILSRNGDRPAIAYQTTKPGLHILLHETSQSRITYKTPEKWAKFLRHKDLEQAASSHAARGLPPKGFREGYSRHVKSLVAVGHGVGADQEFGLETEFVALTNPYGDDFSGTMTVQLLYQGKPRPDTQVELFERPPSGKVKIRKLRTNSKGVASFATQPGYVYLADSVVLREPLGTDKKIVWETLWAALTFKVP
ncbi:MAG: DUF4198 domain-containing protein [Paracoccaceae bacterium]